MQKNETRIFGDTCRLPDTQVEGVCPVHRGARHAAPLSGRQAEPPHLHSQVRRELERDRGFLQEKLAAGLRLTARSPSRSSTA